MTLADSFWRSPILFSRTADFLARRGDSIPQGHWCRRQLVLQQARPLQQKQPPPWVRPPQWQPAEEPQDLESTAMAPRSRRVFSTSASWVSPAGSCSLICAGVIRRVTPTTRKLSTECGCFDSRSGCAVILKRPENILESPFPCKPMFIAALLTCLKIVLSLAGAGLVFPHDSLSDRRRFGPDNSRDS